MPIAAILVWLMAPGAVHAQMDAGVVDAVDGGAAPVVEAIPVAAPEPEVERLPEPPVEIGEDEEEADVGLDPTVVLHGFVSQGFIFTTDNNYLARSSDGSFEMTEVGVNVTALLTEQLRAGLQLFARDLGPIGNYSAKFDWFYLDYRFSDLLGVRAGRTKLPFGLFNDSSDFDAARAPILLPQSVYPLANRDFLLAQTGVEVYGRLDLEGAGAFAYNAYAGTIFLDVPSSSPGSPFVLLDLRVPYIVGGRLMWDSPLEGLRVGASVQALRLETDLQMGMMRFDANIDAVLAIGSIELVTGALTLAAEYSRWFVQSETDPPGLFPASDTVSERGYVLAAYRFAPWLETSVYYSVFFPDTDDRNGRDAYQHDVAVTGRFDVNEHWLIKIEAHYMHGTAGLDDGLNDGVTPDMLETDWLVFLAKTTAFF